MGNVNVCNGSKCTPRGASDVMSSLEKCCKNDPNVRLDFRSCTGYCELGPNVEVNGNIVNHCTELNVCEKVKQAMSLPEGDGAIGNIDIEEILENDIL